MTASYPDARARVVGFHYLNDFLLTRAIAAVQRRTGEDADYVLAESYRCSVLTERGERHEIVVPRGFITDLSTQPRIARPFFGRVGPHLEASIVHDWLYVAWQVEGGEPTEDRRRWADDVFLAAMKAAGMGAFKRQVLYRAVRWFGRGVFRGREERIFRPVAS